MISFQMETRCGFHRFILCKLIYYYSIKDKTYYQNHQSYLNRNAIIWSSPFHQYKKEIGRVIRLLNLIVTCPKDSLSLM